MEKKTYAVNLELMKDCQLAVSKDKARPAINGIFIQDDGGLRHYVGTNGHILVHACEKIDTEELKDGIIVKLCSKIGKTDPTFPHAQLEIFDDKVGILHAEPLVACEIIDEIYPNYKMSVPKTDKLATEYTAFNPDYMNIVKKILGSSSIQPIQGDANQAALWEKEVNGWLFQIVLMPVRLS